MNIDKAWIEQYKKDNDTEGGTFAIFRTEEGMRKYYYIAGYKQGVKDEKKRISDGLRELERESNE